MTLTLERPSVLTDGHWGQGVDRQQFGLRLRELRSLAGLTQVALAKRLSELAGRTVPQQSVARYESGTMDVPAILIPHFASALGVPVAELFTEPGADVPAPQRGRPPIARDDSPEEPPKRRKKR